MSKFHSGNPRNDVDPEVLRQTFSYDPKTGFLLKGRKRVGWVHKATGYRYVSFDGREYKEHRVSWAVHFGVWPEGQIDHRNRKRADNRLLNLRDVGGGQNQANTGTRKDNTSGVRGVTFHPKHKKFMARIRAGSKRIHLGYFATAEEASAAYEAAKLAQHPVA